MSADFCSSYPDAATIVTRAANVLIADTVCLAPGPLVSVPVSVPVPVPTVGTTGPPTGTGAGTGAGQCRCVQIVSGSCA